MLLKFEGNKLIIDNFKIYLYKHSCTHSIYNCYHDVKFTYMYFAKIPPFSDFNDNTIICTLIKGCKKYYDWFKEDGHNYLLLNIEEKHYLDYNLIDYNKIIKKVKIFYLLG